MFFEDMAQLDLLEPIHQEIEVGRIKVLLNEETGKPEVEIRQAIDPNYPWIHSVRGKERVCLKWLHYYFKYYGLVPKSCHGCWKIVTRPRNLKMAIELVQLQKEMGVPSKVGLETRDYSPALWHGFWYGYLSTGLEGALELHKKVEKRVQNTFGMQTKVTLKRACTEMEIRKGPSEYWKYTESDEILEEMLDNLFPDIGPVNADQGPVLQAHVYRFWVRKAYADGDLTVWDYADRRSFVRPSTTYEGSSLSHFEKQPELLECHPSKWSGKEEGDERASRILRLSQDG